MNGASRLAPLLAAMSLLGQTKSSMTVVLLGPPGSGKSTQAEKIAAEFSLTPLSSGDMLRKEAKTGSPLGKRIETAMNAGELVSDDIVNQLIADRFANASSGFILDGYPRTIAQAKFLDRLLADRKMPGPVILNITLPEAEIIARLASRGRPDDKPETVRERIQVYERETKPLLDYYASGNLHNIDGVGTPEQVYERVRSALRGGLQPSNAE